MATRREEIGAVLALGGIGAAGLALLINHEQKKQQQNQPPAGGGKNPIAKFTHTADGLTLTLDGSPSEAVQGKIVQYTWEVSTQPTKHGEKVTYNLPKAGTYTVKLTVQNSSENTDTAQQKITAKKTPSNPAQNQPPVASFTYTTDGLKVSLDASSSHDPDGNIVKYRWYFIGQTHKGVNPTVYAPSSGSYKVKLVVTDNDGATDSVTKKISATKKQAGGPTARFSLGLNGNNLSVDASSSFDDTGTITEYDWTILNKSTNQQQTAKGKTHSFSLQHSGDIFVQLVVHDSNGKVDQATQDIQYDGIPNPDKPPVAAFNYSVSGQTVSLDASGSYDPDGSIKQYTWETDGQTFHGKTKSYQYGTGGQKTVKLTVVDNSGSQDSVSHSFNVQNPPSGNQAPSAVMSVSRDGLTVKLDGSQSSDPDGSIVKYEWETNGKFFRGETTTHSYGTPGKYNITLTVTDNTGAKNSTSKSVQVARTHPQSGLAPKEKSNTSFSSDFFEVALYNTKKLHANNGANANEMAARYLHRALNRLNVNHSIYYGFDPIDAPTERALCTSSTGTGVLKWWNTQVQNGDIPVVAKDSNALQTNAKGGGCAFIGGVACAFPGYYVDTIRPLVENSSGRLEDNCSDIMHEVGHNMGFHHDPNPGDGYNLAIENSWYRTPTMAHNNAYNLCHKWIPKRKYSRQVEIMHYNQCVSKYMNFKVEGLLTQGVPVQSCPQCDQVVE